MDWVHELPLPFFPIPLMVLDWDKVRDRELYRPRGQLEQDLEETKQIMGEIRDRGMLNLYMTTRDKLFPMDTTGSKSHYNRAGDKLAEIIKAIPALTEGKQTFLDVAGGPGAFSKVLLDKGMRGYGITLATENETLAWYPDLEKDKDFTILWGQRKQIMVKDKDGKKIENYVHGDGNIYKVANFDAVKDYLHSDGRDGVDLVVSDGGIGVDINQEVESTRLIMAEMMFALANLKDDGAFVCKLFETHTKLTHDLILIMSSMFEHSYIVKPPRSRKSNSERYFVCTGYLPDAELVDYMLDVYKMSESENARKRLTHLPDTILDEGDDEEETENRVPSADFNERLVEISNALDQQQADTMMQIFEEMHLPPDDLPQNVYTYEGEKHAAKAIFVPIDKQTGQLQGELKANVLESTVEELAKENILVFPYKRYTMGNIYQIFYKLKQWVPTIKMWQHYEPRGALIFKDKLPDFGFDEYKRIPVLESINDYDINQLTDYFTEYARMKAKVKGQEISPEEFWRRNADWIVHNMREQNKSITSYEMREFIFKVIKEATQFKLTTSFFMYDLVAEALGRSIRVLDPCGGWGDRRLAAMANDNVQSHVAYDPNTDLTQGYAEMDEYFLPADTKRKFIFVPKPASEINKRLVGDVDLVFTSPPYFDYEDYSKNPGQSIATFPTLDAWLHGFLFDMLDKSWNCLVPGGYLAIHLTDVKRIPMCEPMYKHMGAKKNAVFSGCILTKAKVIVPIWIWRKLE